MAVLAALLATTACAEMPRATSFPTAPAAEFGSPKSVSGRTLALASTHAANNSRAMVEQQGRLSRNRGALRAATFAGAIATGAATAFDASRNLTVALGLGTGAALAASSLTVDRGYDVTYLAAADALDCVARSTRLAVVADGEAQGLRDRLAAQAAVIDSVYDRLDAADRRAARLAKANGATSADRLPDIELAGLGLAGRANAATDDIIGQARRQVAAQMPDRAAFAAALQSVGALGLGAGNAVAGGLNAAPPPPPPPPPIAPAIVPPPAPAGVPLQSDPDAEARLKGAVAAIEAARAQLDTLIVAAVRDGKASLEGCGFQGVEVATPIVVEGLTDGAVILAADEAVALRISGGNGTYAASFIGPQPGNMIGLSILGDAITLTGDDDLEAGSYLLRIRDLAAKAQVKDVKVTTTE